MKVTRIKPVKFKTGRGKMSDMYAHKKLTEAIRKLNIEMGLPKDYGKRLRAM